MKLVKPFPAFVTSLPEIELPITGARGWMIQGSGQQTVFVQFEETVDVPEHSHSAQWEFALAGKVELHIDGETLVYEAGENFHVPAGKPHSATVHAGYHAMMIFNEPDRYKMKGAGGRYL